MCCVILIFKKCQSEKNENFYCKNNCIKPKASVNKKISNVIIEVYKNGEEIWPPSKGCLDIIGNYLFCKKKRSVREKDVLTSCHGPSAVAVVVNIPKIKKGWQCFLLNKNKIASIKHSILDSLTGRYIVNIEDNKDKYCIKINKLKIDIFSKQLDSLIHSLKNH
jgi:hypothetical protein